MHSSKTVRLPALALTALLICASLAVPAGAQQGTITVQLNGQALNLAPPPLERAGRVFVPLRGVFENMGATVVYANGEINATRGRHTIQLHIGSQSATVDGQTQTVDVAPFIVGASTYVPLRFISQALGASVNWDGQNDIVSIVFHDRGQQGGAPPQMVTPPPAAPPAPPPPPAPSALRVVDMVPRPDSTIPGNHPTIQAGFADGVADPNAVHVLFDGRDVTQDSYVSGRGITYTPPSPIPPGQHEVVVSGRDRSGAPFRMRWQFTSGSDVGRRDISYAIRDVHPEPGMSVGHDFEVAGVTAPNAAVTVQVGVASEPRTFGHIVGGLLGLNGSNSVQVSVTARDDGSFRAPVSIDAPGGSTLGIVITSSDPVAGLSANPVRYTVHLR
jgi:hypothetical protein